MNKIELRLWVDDKSLPPCSAEPVSVEAQVWVDGKRMECGHLVDVIQFARSAKASGKYEIFTCDCGVAQCAGIYEGISVEISDSEIRWSFLSPISIYGVAGESRCNITQSSVCLSFVKRDYVEAIRKFCTDLNRVKKLHRTGLRWPIRALETDSVQICLENMMKPPASN